MAEPEIYPMPSFLHLGVKDIAASTRWYEALGFQKIYQMPPAGTPFLVHMRWTKYADFLLVPEQPSATPKGLGIAVTFATTMTNIDALYAKAESLGARIVSEIGDKPWNTREFTLNDPDGFTIVFTAGPVEQNLSMETISQRASPGRPA